MKSDLMGNEGLKEMICDFLKFLNAFDMSSNYSFFLFVNSHSAENLGIH